MFKCSCGLKLTLPIYPIYCSCGKIYYTNTDFTVTPRIPSEPYTCRPCQKYTMECPHLTDDTCNAVIPTIPTPETCRACTRLGQGINDITVLYAIETLQHREEPVPKYLIDYIKNPDLSHGPGTTLTYLLSWFITKPEGCSCPDRALTMNLWKKQGCKENFSTIMGWLRESALDNNIRYSEWVVACIVRLAISISR